MHSDGVFSRREETDPPLRTVSCGKAVNLALPIIHGLLPCETTLLSSKRLRSLLMLAFSRTTGLNVARADRYADGLSIPSGTAPALHDRVKAILPETIVFFPLPLNKAQLFTFGEYPLASRVTFSRGVILCAL